MNRRLFFGLLLLAPAALVVSACVSGATPDCTMAHNNCGPALVDGSLADATPDRDSGATDAVGGGDEADAPLDAKMVGDEGGG